MYVSHKWKIMYGEHRKRSPTEALKRQRRPWTEEKVFLIWKLFFSFSSHLISLFFVSAVKSQIKP